MTKEQLAEKLNGREYRQEISAKEAAEADASGLVAIFGASDDLLEFRGAIDDEVGAWEGVTVYLTKDGLLKNKCDDEDCPYFEEIRANTKETVTALWDKDGYSWIIESTLPYAPFEVMEGEETYCRGIVIQMPVEPTLLGEGKDV